MKLPDNFDELPESDGTAGRLKPPPGTYVCSVIRVQFQMSKSGRPMLVFDLDIAEGPFSRWYSNDNDDRADRNIEPRWLRMYQLTDGSSAPVFKGLLRNFERSNDFILVNHVVNGEFDEQSLLRLLIGVVCAGEEYKYNGQIRMSLKPDRTLPVERVRLGQVPEARIKGVDGVWRKASEPAPEQKAAAVGEDMEHVDEIDIPF